MDGPTNPARSSVCDSNRLIVSLSGWRIQNPGRSNAIGIRTDSRRERLQPGGVDRKVAYATAPKPPPIELRRFELNLGQGWWTIDTLIERVLLQECSETTAGDNFRH